MKLAIRWSPNNVQRVLALVDTGADSSLIYGNPGRFPGPATYIDSYGGKTIDIKAVTLPLGIVHLPLCPYKAYVSPVPGYILDVDVLQVLSADLVNFI